MKADAEAVSIAQGAVPMSMAETQAMKHRQAAEARGDAVEPETEQSTLILDAPEVVEGDPEVDENKE